MLKLWLAPCPSKEALHMVVQSRLRFIHFFLTCHLDNVDSERNKTKLYETHIPISGVERTVLTVASAVTALQDPLRGGMAIHNRNFCCILTRFAI